MAIYENLIYFLKNGKFENINFGITRAELTEMVGNPDFILFRKAKSPAVVKYDSIEFYFENGSENGRLNIVQITYPFFFSKSEVLFFEAYDWTLDFTIEDAIAFLNEHNIKFEEIPYPVNFDFWRLLKTKGEVQIHFTNQVDEKIWQLHKISRTIELNQRKTPTKQISFEIEEKFYNQLKEKAEERRISIANQCKEIVEKYLKNKQ